MSRPARSTPSTALTLLTKMSLAGAVVVLFGLWPLAGGDFWMWMTVGRYTWQHGGPPQVDVFSYTSAGEPFLAHSWLAALVFYGVERAGGTLGLGVLRLLLVTTALVFALRTARLLGASWAAITLVAPVTLCLVWSRLEFRPMLFTSALLSLQLWLVVSVHVGTRDWRWLWVLVPVYGLAVNMHGGWVQLPAMLVVIGGALAMMEGRKRWVGSRPVSHLSLRQLALVLGACGLALFANPYGRRLVHFPIEMQADWIRMNGWEWQSPWANPVWGLVGGGKLVNLEVVFWGYAAVVVGVLVVRLRPWRTADFVPPALMAFWLAMSLWHLRAVSDAVLLTSPFVAAALPAWRVVGGVLSLVVATTALQVAIPPVAWWTNQEDPRVVRLAEALTRLGVTGNVYANEGNAWLLWKFHPALRVEYTFEFVAGERLWRQSLADHRALQSHFERHQVDFVVLTELKSRGALDIIPDMLDAGWRLVHFDVASAILVRR